VFYIEENVTSSIISCLREIPGLFTLFAQLKSVNHRVVKRNNRFTACDGSERELAHLTRVMPQSGPQFTEMLHSRQTAVMHAATSTHLLHSRPTSYTDSIQRWSSQHYNLLLTKSFRYVVDINKYKKFLILKLFWDMPTFEATNSQILPIV